MRVRAGAGVQGVPAAGERPLKPYQAAVAGAEATQPLIEEFDPDAVVVDILTVAAALAAAEGGAAAGPRSSPTCCPSPSPGRPPYSTGARLPRTRLGAAAVGAAAGRCCAAARSGAGAS